MAKGNDKTRPAKVPAAAKDTRRAPVRPSLGEAREQFLALAPHATARRLEVAADLFSRAVAAWGDLPPTQEQLAVIREHIVDVLRLAERSPHDAGLRSA
jgi:hypothetical protein